AVSVPLVALKSAGGSSATRVTFSSSRRLVAWGQCTMVDSLNDLDADNAWGVEIIEVDGNRIDPMVHGGAHWGSEGSPNNVHPGAWAGTARSVTFRIGATHTSDLDVFGVGCAMTV